METKRESKAVSGVSKMKKIKFEKVAINEEFMLYDECFVKVDEEQAKSLDDEDLCFFYPYEDVYVLTKCLDTTKFQEYLETYPEHEPDIKELEERIIMLENKFKRLKEAIISTMRYAVELDKVLGEIYDSDES